MILLDMKFHGIISKHNMYTSIHRIFVEREVPWQCLSSDEGIGTELCQTYAVQIMQSNRPTVLINPGSFSSTSACLYLWHPIQIILLYYLI